MVTFITVDFFLIKMVRTMKKLF